MMGVYIKGMDKPQNCADCGIGACVCRLWEQLGKDRFYERHSDCPLVEVKAPHGRLIDIDKIMDANTNWELGMTKVPTFEELVLAPTVIEAEVE